MIQGEFEDAEGTSAIRSSLDDFGLVVEATEKLLSGLELGQQQLSDVSERSSELSSWARWIWISLRSRGYFQPMPASGSPDERKRSFVGPHFWARGSFVSTVIREYIRN